MKAEEKKIITAFLEKTLNYSTDKVASIFVKNGDDEELTPNALDVLLPDDVARVQGLKDSANTMFDNGYKKAQGEVLSKTETDIKTKFGISSEKQGVELIEEIIAAKTTPAKAADPEKVKLDPLYLKMEKDLNDQIKAAKAEGETKLKEYQDGVAKEKTFSKVASKADLELQKLKPILSKDPEKAKNQKKLLLQTLEGFTYEENGDELVVLKDGKRHEDNHGRPITFASLVKETANQYWDFEQGEEHQGSGAENGGAKGNQAAAQAGKKWTGKIPKNDDEFSQMFSGLPDDADQRMALTDAYNESQKAV